ncbi:epoxyqueuosine reductase [Candidatus Aerophobetes bacterium]|nr:epoxyqueuosine reductase [Candidatus Aerophobetes bacterium]
MEEENKNYSLLKDIAFSSGMSLFGVARVDNLKHKIMGISPEIIDSLPFAISLAFRLSDKVIEDIKDHPTQLYLHHYRQVNYLLDRTALLLTDFIQKKGYQALPIPASQVIDWENQKGHLSHKLVAEQAGLGWMGRNNLLITPEWGARVRLVTVLTDFPLKVDKKLERGCGSCKKCIGVCPAGAIKEKREDFDHLACFERLRKFRKEYNIPHYICGICVKACQGPSIEI